MARVANGVRAGDYLLASTSEANSLLVHHPRSEDASLSNFSIPGCPVAACATTPPSNDAASVAATSLAPRGKLRAAINFGNPILATRDPGTGQARGVSVDLARELARWLGVPVELVLYDAAGKVVEGLKTDSWDIAFVAIDPARAVELEYSAPYVVIEGAYLDGHFMVINQAMATPKGRGRGAGYLAEFVEEMKASGFVTSALQRHGIEGAALAPPARPDHAPLTRGGVCGTVLCAK